MHSEKEPSTLADPWDTNNGLLCQRLGSCSKINARNMKIQLLYLCGNELKSIAMYLTSQFLGKDRSIKKAEMIRRGKENEILYNLLHIRFSTSFFFLFVVNSVIH